MSRCRWITMAMGRGTLVFGGHRTEIGISFRLQPPRTSQSPSGGPAAMCRFRNRLDSEATGKYHFSGGEADHGKSEGEKPGEPEVRRDIVYQRCASIRNVGSSPSATTGRSRAQ